MTIVEAYTPCRSGKTYSVVETGMRELTVKGINNQHDKTYQFDRSEKCTVVYFVTNLAD